MGTAKLDAESFYLIVSVHCEEWKEKSWVKINKNHLAWREKTVEGYLTYSYHQYNQQNIKGLLPFLKTDL